MIRAQKPARTGRIESTETPSPRPSHRRRLVRVYIAGFVHKFFNALQSVGDDRAKELGEHSNYDQKCVVIP